MSALLSALAVATSRIVDLSVCSPTDPGRSDRRALSLAAPFSPHGEVVIYVGDRTYPTQDAAVLLRDMARRLPAGTLRVVATTDAAEKAWTRAIETGDALA